MIFKLLTALVFSMTFHNLFSLDVYNIYHRNDLTGRVELISNKKADANIRYIAEKNGNDMTITGYYYDSKKIKFIDSIKDGLLYKSTYFSKEEKKIYERNYTYNDNKQVKYIETRTFKTSAKKFYSQHFFRQENNEIHCDFIINTIISNSQQTVHENQIGSIVFSNEYTPIKRTKKIMRYDALSKKTNIGNFQEIWTKNDHGYTYSTYLENNLLYKYTETTTHDSFMLENEYFEENKNRYLYVAHKYNPTEYSKLQIYNGQKNDEKRTANVINTSYREIFFSDFNGNRTSSKIEIHDCIIFFDYTDDKKELTQEELKVPLDFFDYSYPSLLLE